MTPGVKTTGSPEVREQPGEPAESADAAGLAGAGEECEAQIVLARLGGGHERKAVARGSGDQVGRTRRR